MEGVGILGGASLNQVQIRSGEGLSRIDDKSFIQVWLQLVAKTLKLERDGWVHGNYGGLNELRQGYGLRDKPLYFSLNETAPSPES